MGDGPPPGLSDVTAISSGWEGCYALLKDGSVRAWGLTQFGPVTVPPGVPRAKAISVGGRVDPSLFVLREDGTVWDAVSPPPDGLNDVVAIGRGGGHLVALRRSGTLVAWQGAKPQVRSTPPPGLTGVTAISAGENHTLALLADGRVAVWGYNDVGQIEPPRGYGAVVYPWTDEGYGAQVRIPATPPVASAPSSIPTSTTHPTSSSGQGGCYIATAVYGSYDAPQVLVLRRFRDEALAQSAPGRAFIRAYYALSPTLARRLSGLPSVTGITKRALDRLVTMLDPSGSFGGPK